MYKWSIECKYLCIIKRLRVSIVCIFTVREIGHTNGPFSRKYPLSIPSCLDVIQFYTWGKSVIGQSLRLGVTVLGKCAAVRSRASECFGGVELKVSCWWEDKHVRWGGAIMEWAMCGMNHKSSLFKRFLKILIDWKLLVSYE